MDDHPVFRTLFRCALRDPHGSGRATAPVAWATSRGGHRSENQDRLAVARAQNGLLVAVLADGMGGMKDGAKAAAIAVSAVVSYCATVSHLGLEKLVEGALRAANDHVHRSLQGTGGAACVILAWNPQTAQQICVGHAGDSRAYLVDLQSNVEQITVDDTLTAQLVKMGRPSPPDALPVHRSLLQFIGSGPDMQAHVRMLSGKSRGILLTTDGVHSVPVSVLTWIVRASAHGQALAERLVTLSEWDGSKDNASVVAISLQNGSQLDPGTCALEVWLPNDHIVWESIGMPTSPHVGEARELSRNQPLSEPAVKAEAQDISGVQPSSGDKTYSKSDKTPKPRKGRSKRPAATSYRDRMLPMIEFEVPADEPVKTDPSTHKSRPPTRRKETRET